MNSEQSQAGDVIERPRSALHSGDFTEGPHPASRGGNKALIVDSNFFDSERQEWLATSPPRNFSPFVLDTRFPPVDRFDVSRSRAPSLSSSLSSSFVMKPPTSPLVQSESNDDLEFSSNMNPIDITPSFQRYSRRHTLQPSHSMISTPSIPTATNSNRPFSQLRRDSTYPYQAHQPRRSFTSNPLQTSFSSPQTPALSRSRKASFSSDSSPLHASMVGSYEESILRGRMSTTPSKPLDFVAQIGVLGLGKCKSSLRCPAHVTIPFPAVFYSYETTAHGRSGKAEDGPSPYVGQIDLENNLPNPEIARDRRKRKVASTGRIQVDESDMLEAINSSQPTEQERRRFEKQKRRSTSPRAPPGGSYRIPEKGQLQIIIKNPNKTAVKLFLVPYDLAGMESGTKTFIRQRSYSAGPIIISPVSASPQSTSPNPLDRPTLRYLVHLHICSPSRGRFYLYKSIRVVFANRVPDGKEKLRNEISLPEPRFSVYSALGLGLTSSAGANLVAEKAYRRRSSGFALSHSNRNFGAMDGVSRVAEVPVNSPVFPYIRALKDTTLVQPIPFSLQRRPIRNDEGSGEDRPSNLQSPISGKSSRPETSQSSEMSWDSGSSNIGAYDKLNKGDVGYGGNVFASSPDGKHIVAESLLAQRLRDLEVGLSSHQVSEDSI